MAGHRGAVNPLLLFDLRELTMDLCELRCRIAAQPHGLTRKQCFAILGQALKLASLRLCGLNQCIQLVSLGTELRCALLAAPSGRGEDESGFA